MKTQIKKKDEKKRSTPLKYLIKRLLHATPYIFRVTPPQRLHL